MGRRKAFTLLELMLAVTLASLLVMGVLAVLTQVGASALNPPVASRLEGEASDEQANAAATLSDHALEAAVALLRRDMAHATRIEAEANRLELVGPCALEARRRAGVHRPVRVIYTLERIEGRRWLVRTQRALDVATNQNTQRDLVLAGLARFRLSPKQIETKRPAQTQKPRRRQGEGDAASRTADGETDDPKQPRGDGSETSQRERRERTRADTSQAGESRVSEDNSLMEAMKARGAQRKQKVATRIWHQMSHQQRQQLMRQSGGFFRKHLPESLRETFEERQAAARQGERSRRVAQGARDASGRRNRNGIGDDASDDATDKARDTRQRRASTDDETSQGTSESADARHAQQRMRTVWRLHAWSRDQRRPTHERLVTMR